MCKRKKVCFNFKHEGEDENGVPVGKLTWSDTGKSVLKNGVWARLNAVKKFARTKRIQVIEF